jgi:hypothetical protein
MAGLVEDAMKQNVKKVKPLTAGVFTPDDVNNTAVMAPESQATAAAPVNGAAITDGPIAFSRNEDNQTVPDPTTNVVNPRTPPPPPINVAPTPDPNGGGTSPLNRPQGTSPDANGSGVRTNPVTTPPVTTGNPATPVYNTPSTQGDPNAGTSATNAAGATPTWNPKTGLVDGISQGGVADATARGYTPTAVGEAKGYTATGYDPTLSGENLSAAVDRIIDKGGALMQRADAKGRAEANRRGVLNSTMGVQASQNAVLDKATEIGAGDVQNAQFNAGQKNDAAAFSANATNRANEFGAGEANKMMMFAAEQYNLASKFAAEAENAANAQNAQAHTAAMQRYNDALNAARAAEQDAENQARRDTAQFAQQTREGNADRTNRMATAGIAANASVQTANINAASRSADAAADREFRAGENAADRRIRREEFDINTQTRVDGMGQDAFNRYTSGRNDILTRDMEPDQRNAALRAWDTTWAGNPYLPIDIDLSAYDD